MVKSISVTRSCVPRSRSILPTLLTMTSHTPRSEKSPPRTVTRWGMYATASRRSCTSLGELLLVLVDEHQLVRDALDRQSVSHMCADMTHADHAENSFLCHKNTSFLKNGVPV